MRSERVARSALVFALVAPITYLAQRIYEIARVGRLDPSLALRTTHVDFLWRVAIATWWAGAAALAAYALLRRTPRHLAFAAIAAGALVLALAMRFP